jgi:Asp/Glu/hydantoin racemase
MAKRLALIHTVTSLVPVFQDLLAELAPDLYTFNIVDESLLQNVIREDNLSAVTARRVVGHLLSAEEAGADLAMCTCSSIGPAVEMARPLLNIPALRVDEPMAELAVQTGHRVGGRIGVAATLRTTLEPTAALIDKMATQAGRKVEVISKLCEGAFDAVIAGDTGTHDAIVSAGLRDLIEQSDVIVLAQASMARVVAALPEEDKQTPILSSPRLAVEHLANIL